MRKNNTFFFITLLSILFLNISCNCGTISCGMLSDKFKIFANQKIADSLVYINDYGQKLIFTVDKVYESQSGDIPCEGRPFNGNCKCNCPVKQKQVLATLKNDKRVLVWDSTFMQSADYNQLIYNISQDENSIDSVCKIFYSVFGFGNNQINADFQNIYSNTNNIYHNSIVLNNRTYTDVIEANHDTMPSKIKGGTIKGLISKTYYAKNIGLIAFYDRIEKSYFYLK